MTGKVSSTRDSIREWLKQRLFHLSPRGYAILIKVVKRLTMRGTDHQKNVQITTTKRFKHAYEDVISAAHATQNLEWVRLPSGPFPRLDAGAIQIAKLLYCIGGYEDQDHVLSFIDVFDLAQCEWMEQIPMPPEVPQSHLALTCEEGRYIYFAGGQVGPRCNPAVADVYVFDTQARTWHSLPSLPEPRYAATMQLWRGRLHILGGAMSDRYTPASDHWSLGVKSGQALEGEWRVEPSIPRGGMHRVSAVIHDQLHVFGGQEGDFMPVAGDPHFTCTGNTVEYVYADVFQLGWNNDGWIRLPDMPVPASHTEFSIVANDYLVYIAGGSCYKDPHTFEIELIDLIQMFDTRSQTWSIAGHLPFRVKTVITALYDGWLYISAGQRDQGPHDPRPGAVEKGMWRARLIDHPQNVRNLY
jgi:hypothetical protein